MSSASNLCVLPGSSVAASEYAMWQNLEQEYACGSGMFLTKDLFLFTYISEFMFIFDESKGLL